jgi:hypothetical protein
MLKTGIGRYHGVSGSLPGIKASDRRHKQKGSKRSTSGVIPPPACTAPGCETANASPARRTLPAAAVRSRRFIAHDAVTNRHRPGRPPEAAFRSPAVDTLSSGCGINVPGCFFRTVPDPLSSPFGCELHPSRRSAGRINTPTRCPMFWPVHTRRPHATRSPLGLVPPDQHPLRPFRRIACLR